MNVPRREGKRSPFSFGRKKNADSANTIAAIGAMAKRGTLRATTTSPGQRNFGRAERNAVQREVDAEESKYGPVDNPGVTGSRAQRVARATKKVDKADDVGGYDGPAYRKRDAERNKKGKQEKKYLPGKGE
jgi:hypothetical protein